MNKRKKKKETLTPDKQMSAVNAVVRQKYPTAICVHTVSSHIDGGEEYRIWPTNGWHETRYIGNGKTPGEAWQSAYKKISA